ncbi:SIR2 family protein [Dickeya chrysanthemi]|uniref:SIR2 family protein n=1 Tax=Dickeya chrysanthemi TaxID=556 RepID=UPI0025A2CC3F|nr:SIR2 family protein [Dickeya chrysanthemi]WJM85269.1 SIR2 family protein [Dickeya chrysanthemi]
MKLLNYEMLVQSLFLDIKKKNEICFLFGSAISLPDEGIGIPSVDGMVELIKEYLYKLEIHDGFNQYISQSDSSGIYQSAFEYLLGVGSQDDVREILSTAVNQAKDKNGDWKFPKTIVDLASLIKRESFNIKNILTTNFDPLIEEALSDGPYNIQRFELTEDIHFDTSISHNQKQLNIIHLHGFWEGDTMHTPSQLSAIREETSRCLKRILTRSKLYVIGYGGWDDIINQILCELVNEKKSNYEIRWAFYSNDEESINLKNKKLFDNLNPALPSSRFNSYIGVNCNNLFSDVYKRTYSTALNIKNDFSQKKEKSNNGIIDLSEVYKPQNKHQSIKLKDFPNIPDPSHDFIRLSEQGKASDLLKADGSFTLISGWGYGKMEFIASFIKDDYSNYKYYRVDFSGVSTLIEAESQFIKDIGIDFTTFITISPEEQTSIILFDNIIEIENTVQSYLDNIISIIKDYNSNVKAVFISPRNIGLQNHFLYLPPLNLADTGEYLKSSTNSSITIDDLELIHRNSSGLPSKLDKIKEFLSFTSISHVLSASSDEITPEIGLLTDSIPKYLLDKIIELSKSESNENKRIFQLLQIFCILECGEEPKNITQAYYNNKFRLTDFSRLINMGLIYPITIRDLKDFKINKINPVVKDYVRNTIDTDTYIQLRKIAIKLVLGDIWSNHHVTISRKTLLLLDNNDVQPGNAHHLLLSVLGSPHKELESVDIYIKAAVSYAYYLERNCRYKELVSFVNEAIKILEINKDINYYRMMYFVAEGMRMLDRNDESIGILENVADELNSNNYTFNKELQEQITASLILCYSKSDIEKAYNLAEITKKESPKNSYIRFLCESVLAKKLPKNERIRNLNRLEKKARNSNETVIANNISLDLSSLNPSEKDRHINTVLSSEKSTYTRVRALLKKYEGVLFGESIGKVTGKDIINLSDCYKYLFIQRMDNMFDKCHSLLWTGLLIDNKLDELFDIFLTSSLVWRINGQKDKELEYSKKIRTLLNNKSETHILYIQYIDKRCLILSQ